MSGKATRRDLDLALITLKAVATHLARARMGLRGPDDQKAFKLQREFRGIREVLRGIRSRVGKPLPQIDLEKVA